MSSDPRNRRVIPKAPVGIIVYDQYTCSPNCHFLEYHCLCASCELFPANEMREVEYGYERPEECQTAEVEE